MPELPEVETTVSGLQKSVKGLIIKDVWTDYFKKTAHGHKQNLKNKAYAENFIKRVRGKKILNARRIGKNVIIDLSDGLSILTHMKMTGHYLYGQYKFSKKEDAWQAISDGVLKDPFNRYLHLVFTLSNNNHLVLSDVRKFAKILLLSTEDLVSHPDIKTLGPDPFSQNLTISTFRDKLSNARGPVKSALMNQEIVSGIGNIYSDEMLWQVGIHPETPVSKLRSEDFSELFKAMRKILKRSIEVGGDSTSDFRKVDGERGGFQNEHQVYRKLGQKCNKRGCKGTISRIVVRGRSSHFCPVHQKKW